MSEITVSVGVGRVYKITIDGTSYACTYGQIDGPPRGWKHAGWHITPAPTAEHSLQIANNLPRQD